MKLTNITLPAMAILLALAASYSIAQADSAAAPSPEPTVAKEPEKMTEKQQCDTGCALPKSDEELRKLLTPEQYRITQQNGTERPFANDFWNKKEPGIYVDVVSGEPLFSSTDKFDSGTGWPSFTKPVVAEAMKEVRDVGHGMVRVEVRSARANSHLGHVFDDGPKPTGLRYCINSGSLRFVPVEKLADEGLGQFLPLFGKAAPTGKSGAQTERAIFAAGCFWGVEEAFLRMKGVTSTAVGYSGGATDNPTYREVCGGKTGHAEVVEVVFDPSIISYRDLVESFFALHDPTTPNRQGPDIGTQYRSGIFFTSPEQKVIASEVKQKLGAGKAFRSPIVTEITPASTFFRAEEYHQQYLRKNGRAACH